jgi:S1-C subfamily serine protease
MKPSPSLLLALSLSAAAAVAAPLDRSVVEVLVTVRRPDPGIPWRRDRPRQQGGYGVVVGPGRVLTTENLVRNATLVELRRAGDARRITATIVQADPQADLALLQFPDAPATAGLAPLAIATNGTREGKVVVAKFDEAAQVQTAEGTVTEAALRVLPDAPWPGLQLSVQNDLHIGQAGAPVVRDSELAGLIVDYDEENSVSLALPAALLRRFVDDVQTPPYLGIPVAGFTWTALLAPDTRRYLGMPDDARGVLVLQTLPGSGADGVLQPQDVIQEWDGCPIDSEGYYEDPTWGRLLFANLISSRRAPGESVPVRILRDGRAQTVSVTLRARADEDALIPENAAEAPAEYLVDGGLVLRELSGDALRAAGSRWLAAVNPRAARLYLTRAQFPEKPGDRVVTLVGVLPDPINVGYQHLRDLFVTAVNGKPVRNLAQVFDIVEADGGIERLSLQHYGVDVILDRAQLEAANRRIQAAYNIPHLRYRRTP